MGDVFLDSAYAMKVPKAAKKDPEHLRQMFNFDYAWSAVSDDNVFPLLAKHDAFIPYKHHSAAYKGRPVATANKGHITGMLSGTTLAQHLMQQLLPS